MTRGKVAIVDWNTSSDLPLSGQTLRSLCACDTCQDSGIRTRIPTVTTGTPGPDIRVGGCPGTGRAATVLCPNGVVYQGFLDPDGVHVGPEIRCRTVDVHGVLTDADGNRAWRPKEGGGTEPGKAGPGLRREIRFVVAKP